MSKKITKKEKDAWMLKKYAGSDSQVKPRNVSYELAEGYEFVRIDLFGGKKKGLTIKKKQ